MAPKMEQFNSIPAIFATRTSKLKDFSIIYIREIFFFLFASLMYHKKKRLYINLELKRYSKRNERVEGKRKISYIINF